MLRLETHNDQTCLRGVIEEVEMTGHNCKITIVNNVGTMNIFSHNNSISGQYSITELEGRSGMTIIKNMIIQGHNNVIKNLQIKNLTVKGCNNFLKNLKVDNVVNRGVNNQYPGCITYKNQPFQEIQGMNPNQNVFSNFMPTFNFDFRGAPQNWTANQNQNINQRKEEVDPDAQIRNQQNQFMQQQQRQKAQNQSNQNQQDYAEANRQEQIKRLQQEEVKRQQREELKRQQREEIKRQQQEEIKRQQQQQQEEEFKSYEQPRHNQMNQEQQQFAKNQSHNLNEQRQLNLLQQQLRQEHEQRKKQRNPNWKDEADHDGSIHPKNQNTNNGNQDQNPRDQRPFSKEEQQVRFDRGVNKDNQNLPQQNPKFQENNVNEQQNEDDEDQTDENQINEEQHHNNHTNHRQHRQQPTQNIHRNFQYSQHQNNMGQNYQQQQYFQQQQQNNNDFRQNFASQEQIAQNLQEMYKQLGGVLSNFGHQNPIQSFTAKTMSNFSNAPGTFNTININILNNPTVNFRSGGGNYNFASEFYNNTSSDSDSDEYEGIEQQEEDEDIVDENDANNNGNNDDDQEYYEEGDDEGLEYEPGEYEDEEPKYTEQQIQQTINSFTDFVFDNTGKDADNCAICYDLLKKGQMVKGLPCMHIFHSKCINQWLKQKLQCPLCKVEIVP